MKEYKKKIEFKEIQSLEYNLLKRFDEFAKENITIFEMKKADTTLEDAFMKLIEGGEK